MKKILLFSLVISALSASATIHDVEVGGVGGSSINPPYYAPQTLTIMSGDVVRWTWVGSNHNVTSTSGPESFSSGTQSSGFVFEFTFTAPGVYEYECTVGSHSNTQFGSITVNGVGITNNNPKPNLNFDVYPNPATDFIVINREQSSIANIRILDLTGRLLREELNESSAVVRMDIADLTDGIYFVELSQGDVRIRKKVFVR